MTTDSGMSSPFPNELVDIVIRQLAAEEDSKFLSAAALVNRNTASIVRKLRFSVLALGPHRGEERCARLWDLIQTNPTLVHNVESLTLIDDSSEADEVNAPSCGWVTTDSTYTKLGDVLKALAGNLTTLEVQSSCLQWHYVEEDVQEALFDLFAAPTLTTLRLVGILGMEITPILDCSNLKRLSLKRVTIIENEEDLEAEEETRPDGEVGQLEVLEVVESDEWAFYFLVSSLLRADAKLSLRNLQRLVIAMENPRKSSPNTTVLDKALDQLAGIPLNSLRVEHASHPSFQIDQRTCVFTRWPNLRSLEIAVKPLNGVESWISPVSQALHRMRALEDLTLEVDHSDLRPHATQRIGVWQELESVLMLRDSFRRLVVIINMDKSLQEHAAMEDTLKSCMSSLFKDGKVQVIVKWRHVQMKTSRAALDSPSAMRANRKRYLLPVASHDRESLVCFLILHVVHVHCYSNDYCPSHPPDSNLRSGVTTTFHVRIEEDKDTSTRLVSSTVAMAPQPLSNELVDKITANLDPKTDTSTYSSLALVNHNAAAIVRKIRFKAVTFGPSNWCRRVPGLWDLIKANPNIALNIVSLTLIDSGWETFGEGGYTSDDDQEGDDEGDDGYTSDDSEYDDEEDECKEEYFYPAYQRGWLSKKDPAFPGVVELLHAVKPVLQELEVCSSLSWHRFSPSVQRAVYELALSPVLQSLKLHQFVQIPFSLFVACHNLKQLCFDGIQDDADIPKLLQAPSSEERVVVERQIQLEVLEIKDCLWPFHFGLGRLSRGSAPLPFKSLRRLILGFTNTQDSMHGVLPGQGHLESTFIVFNEEDREAAEYATPEDTLEASMPELLGADGKVQLSVEWLPYPRHYFWPI